MLTTGVELMLEVSQPVSALRQREVRWPPPKFLPGLKHRLQYTVRTTHFGSLEKCRTFRLCGM